MKLVGVSLLGIVGAIAFGMIGLLPSPNSAPAQLSPLPPDTTRSSVITQESSCPAACELTCNADDIEDSEDSPSGSAVEATLRRKIVLLERGKAYLSRVSDYTAKIQKREVVGNQLLDEQTILIKCRHQPFSIYLDWVTGDPGREVLFIEGQNNGKIIAHDGGWKQRIPAFYLSPDGPLAMHDARYPATTAGLLGLIDIMLGVHQEDLRRSNLESCIHDERHEFEGRPCDMFTVTYKSPTESPVYRKSITLIDREWHVPLQSRHFEWPQRETGLTGEELDEATLIESYSFTEIQFESGLTDYDFDRSNTAYRFR